MVRKFLSVGIILVLLPACLPRHGTLPEKNNLNIQDIQSVTESTPSLFTRSELDALSSSESSSAPAEKPLHDPPPPVQLFSSRPLDLPICEESNDDFSLEVLAQDELKKEPDFDIPIVINAKVEQFIQYFQTTARSNFTNWLSRSEKYIPIMKGLLKENGLPEDLVYLSLIESGFNPYAYSRSKASGPWQFIYLTGKRYGLKVNWWVDERRDPEKSTVAAAKYLKDLYDMFECWYLAAAGYNAGENKIFSAIRRYRTEDFWELSKYRFLKQETKDYVPQMIAAALIAKDPEKYGFTKIEYQEPLRYEKVTVPEFIDLLCIAKACEVPLEEVKDLNPELSRGCTPPGTSDYEVKIPLGTKETFLRNFENLLPDGKFHFKTHTVKKGESLARITKLYRVDLDPLLEINRLKKTDHPSAGMKLLIPLATWEEVKPPAKEKKIVASKPSSQAEITYTIRKGDTLWSIANEMGVNIGAISRSNNLQTGKKLIPGDKLKIRMDAPVSAPDESVRAKNGREIIYVVKEGDSLWSIAKKYHVTVSDIKTWNNMKGISRIRPESRLKLRVGEVKNFALN
jgi:membrane-bound lytic murein transglycosylase D